MAQSNEQGTLITWRKDVLALQKALTPFFLLQADICAIPSNRTVTYARIVIDHCPQKEDPNRVCITVGGNLIDYPFELTTRTADMVSSKILWNIVISTKDARFAGSDFKNMYLKTPLD
jgi:hypothetical protein